MFMFGLVTNIVKNKLFFHGTQLATVTVLNNSESLFNEMRLNLRIRLKLQLLWNHW